MVKKVLSITISVIYGLIIGIAVFFRVMSSAYNSVDFITTQGWAGASMNIGFALIVILVWLNKTKWFDRKIGNGIILFFSATYTIPLLALPFHVIDLFDDMINFSFYFSWFSLQACVLIISLIEVRHKPKQ